MLAAVRRSPPFISPLFFAVILLFQYIPPISGLQRIYEYQRYDGWFNNLANPEWGTVGSHLHRDAPSRYQDGVYMLNTNLPSARSISELIFKGPSGIPNQRNVTTMAVFFSQVVAYEIMQSNQISCPLEMHKIPVPKCDPVFDAQCEGKTEIPFVRAKYDKNTGRGFNSPREQVNDRTSWIDASFLYSTQEPWVAALRSWENGTLAEGSIEGYPPFNGPHIPLINPAPPQIHRLMNPERLYMLGDPRANENPGLLSFGLILYRWHNIQARRIQKQHPAWSDEEIFQGARRWVIATLQKITLYDYLPTLLADDNAVPPYRKYRPHVPPGISHAFATAAFRFPHTIVPPGLLFRSRKSGRCEFRQEIGGYPALRLCQNWWNAQDIVQEYSIDEIVLGMASQIAEAEDPIVVEDLRDFVFGPMHFTRQDVVSSSIMRGRDNGLPSYNELRRSFNLPARNWSTINPILLQEKPEMFANLRSLYKGDISRLDAYVGGMLETNGEGPGELFGAIILDQFMRLRDGDRFWFENTQNGLFTKEEIDEIHNTTLRDIIRQTTTIRDDEIQQNVFFWRDGDPCGQPFQVNTSGLEKCVPLMRFDHFTGNEVTYIFSCITLATIPLVCIGIGYLLVQKRKRMGGYVEPCFQQTLVRDVSDNPVVIYQTTEKGAKNKESIRIPVIEWINENYSRTVILVIDSVPSIRLEKPRGSLLRVLDLQNAEVVRVTVSEHGASKSHGPFMVISVPRHYDLIIRFGSEVQCSEVLRELSFALEQLGKELFVRNLPNDILLNSAETFEKRRTQLDRFFREAYSKAFNDSRLSDGITAQCDTVSNDVLETVVTKAELAEALGMRDNDLFVERMFACMAKTNDDCVTFTEFLNVISRFAYGSVREKMKIIFDMCGRDGGGEVKRDEFVEFIRSLNLAAGVAIDDSLQVSIIDNVLANSGVDSNSSVLTYKDFEAICSSIESDGRPVGVHMRGARLQINLDERASLNSFALIHGEAECSKSSWITEILSYLETYRQHIVILFIFTCINLLLFFERFWHYRFETEHRDLRRVMGVGIAITRGAAASLSFCMGLILTTVCRNVITVLRETPLGEYIPFDSSITFHKIVGILAGFWAAIHTVGHCINFYHVATQSQEGLQCLFQEAVFGSNFLPSISYWFYGTITGITGILLVVVMSVIYVFSAPAVLKRAYHAFRITHLLNVLLYALTILHGLPRLLDSPKFTYYVAGPIILFIIDRIIGMRQQYKRLPILSAAILPSDIIYIQFKRPPTFTFRSGQWVRISCPAFSCTFNERHAFSLASAPQDPTLELYIKAVGPWTWNLRNEISCAQAKGTEYPVLHIDGPYGDGNQDWHQYEVAVLIGGGIGITPYASTLTDLVKSKSSGKYSDIKCKKVYFLWICSTQKNYEWFIDVLRRVEERDDNGILEVHVFITQFFHKFDLRTTLLYICERHFRYGTDGRSMFTNLKAVNHFGRPDFDLFLKFVQNKHSDVREIGVFSCGPELLNNQIRHSCTNANRARDAPTFRHVYESF